MEKNREKRSQTAFERRRGAESGGKERGGGGRRARRVQAFRTTRLSNSAQLLPVRSIVSKREQGHRAVETKSPDTIVTPTVLIMDP